MERAQFQKSGQSLWKKHAFTTGHEPRATESLINDIEVDTLVIGGGITGLTTALQLAKANRKVAIVNDQPTSYSTGHLTQILDEEFKTLISRFGEEKIAKVVRSCGAAIDFIEQNILENKMECEFGRLPAVRFTEQEKDLKTLKDELEQAQRLGLKARALSTAELSALPFAVKGANQYEDQAMVDPYAYVLGLRDVLRKLGVAVYDHSRVIEIVAPKSQDKSQNKIYLVKTDRGSVTASRIVMGTHTPIGLDVSRQTRVAPYYSYAIAATLRQAPVDKLYWDMKDPYNYMRPARMGSSEWVIGGRDHKTGQSENMDRHFAEVEAFTQSHGGLGEVVARWGGELYASADGLPYIGQSAAGTWIATGFSGTGLTWGTVAGRLMSNQILGIKDDLTEIYDPVRLKPAASAINFMKENANVGEQYALDLVARIFKPSLPKDDSSIFSLLNKDEGKVVKWAGKEVCAYRNQDDEVQFLTARCPHLGGPLSWNSVDRTWDCKCHGGRFQKDGRVLEGPPLTGLKPLRKAAGTKGPL